jgi:hypothetical protein
MALKDQVAHVVNQIADGGLLVAGRVPPLSDVAVGITSG